MTIRPRIIPCLWFDGEAEAAVQHYVGIFPHSRVLYTSRYGEEGRDIHQHEPGSVMTVEFELDGQRFTALNGGPQFRFSEAISLQVECADQAEIDHYWSRLIEGGSPQPCGWLKDRFGVSWQVYPARMHEMLASGDTAALERVMAALFPMEKLDLATLEAAWGSEK